jgi:hypothetical protein
MKSCNRAETAADELGGGGGRPRARWRVKGRVQVVIDAVIINAVDH